MKTISVKELHEKTGHWLRRVAEEREVVVTERGVPIARVLPVKRRTQHPFARRKLVRGVARLLKRPIGGPDSSKIISTMRDGR